MSTSRKSESEYHPIDCSLHDQLEVFALMKEKIAIKYRHLDSEVRLDDVMILTTVIKDGEEFLKLNSGQAIRLDKLLKVGDIEFKKNATN